MKEDSRWSLLLLFRSPEEVSSGEELDSSPRPLFKEENSSPNHPAATLPFAKFLNHVIPFLNSVLLLNQLNQVVLIAAGVNSCGYIYDSAGGGSHGGNVPAVCSEILRKLEEFVAKDRRLGKGPDRVVTGGVSSLLSGSLSLALCYIQRVFRSGALHPQP